MLESLELRVQGLWGPLPDALAMPPNLAKLVIIGSGIEGQWASQAVGSMPASWNTACGGCLAAVAVANGGKRRLPMECRFGRPCSRTYVLPCCTCHAGGWPESWQSLGKLQSLFLLGNDKLAGTLPSATQLPPSTQLLYLQGNNFSGKLQLQAACPRFQASHLSAAPSSASITGSLWPGSLHFELP